MTLEEISQNPDARAELTRVLRSPWVLRLLVALEDGIDGDDVSDTDDPIASTRKLSRSAGERAMLRKLKNAILPFTPEVQDEPATYGTELTAEEAEVAIATI